MKGKKHDLSPSERNQYVKLLTAHLRDYPEVLFAYLYGSFSEGLPFSDIDVGIYLHQERLSGREMQQYELRKGIDLELLAGLPVDLKVLNYSPLPLRYHVSRGELLFSRDEPTRYAFLEATWRDYFDYYPLARQLFRDLIAVPFGSSVD